MSHGWWLLFGVAAFVVLASGCASRPIIETQIVEKPVPVQCRVELPAECKEAYAVDRVSPSDDALTINRALRIELEERATCELKLRATLKGCNTTQMVK